MRRVWYHAWRNMLIIAPIPPWIRFIRAASKRLHDLYKYHEMPLIRFIIFPSIIKALKSERRPVKLIRHDAESRRYITKIKQCLSPPLITRNGRAPFLETYEASILHISETIYFAILSPYKSAKIYYYLYGWVSMPLLGAWWSLWRKQ